MQQQRQQQLAVGGEEQHNGSSGVQRDSGSTMQIDGQAGMGGSGADPDQWALQGNGTSGGGGGT